MSSSLSQAAFDASFHQNLSVMKLFPGGHSMSGMNPAGPSSNLLRPAGPLQTPGVPQSYPADFSNYGPMYSSYYAKQAQAMAVSGSNNPSARTSPYQRNMYSPSACYQNFQGGTPTGALYPRSNYDYPAHAPR